MTPEQVARLQASVGIAAGTFPERLAAAGPDAQALYRALLPGFAATGTPPPPADAAYIAGLAPERARDALAELAAADLVALDDDGTITGAFPLSARPSRHRVQVDGGPVLHAMCAVDALGIPAMLGRAAMIDSTDPASARLVRVHVAADGALTVDPPEAVVLLASSGDGPLASACCSMIDFHSTADAAEQALARPGTRGVVLAVGDAHALGTALFADLPATNLA